jgi:hypothetical protein
MGLLSRRFLISMALMFGRAHAFVLPRVHSHRACSRVAAKSPFQINLLDFAAIFGGKQKPTVSSFSIGKGDLVAVGSSKDLRIRTPMKNINNGAWWQF